MCVCLFVCCFVVNKEDTTFASGVSCKEHKRVQAGHCALNSSVILLLHLFVFMCTCMCNTSALLTLNAQLVQCNVIGKMYMHCLWCAKYGKQCSVSHLFSVKRIWKWKSAENDSPSDHLALHHLLTNRSSTVNGCRQNESKQLIQTSQEMHE